MFCDTLFGQNNIRSRLRINVVSRVDLDTENKVAWELSFDLVNYALQKP